MIRPPTIAPEEAIMSFKLHFPTLGLALLLAGVLAAPAHAATSTSATTAAAAAASDATPAQPQPKPAKAKKKSTKTTKVKYEKGSSETTAERDRRLYRECKGRPNAGACLGYAS
jgi:hypothetical protein